MKSPYILNPHCLKPRLDKDGSRWRIMLPFMHNGKNLKKKITEDLNSELYVIKVNGKVKEVNKIARHRYAMDLIADIDNILKKDYFNPETQLFEISDKAELAFHTYLDAYIDHSPAKQRREKTKVVYQSYNNVIKAYLNKIGAPEIQLKAVTREIIEDFLAQIQKNGTTSHRDNYLVYIKGVFTYCVEDLDLLQKNPLHRLHTINAKTSKTNRAYPSDLLAKVLADAKINDPNFYLLLRLIFYTLRRPDELLKAQYRDFDFVKGTITFDGDNIKTGITLYSQLPEHLRGELKMLVPEDVRPNDYLFGHINNDGASKRYAKRLFAPNKTPFTHFQDKFKALQKRLNLEPGYTIYSFKHTGIVYMIEEMKWTDDQIITYTGHTDTKILGRYARDAKRPKEVHLGTI